MMINPYYPTLERPQEGNDLGIEQLETLPSIAAVTQKIQWNAATKQSTRYIHQNIDMSMIMNSKLVSDINFHTLV